MQETIGKNYSLVLDQVSSTLSGLQPVDLVQQPSGCPNHALWTLGHLVFSAQAIGGELGMDPWLPADWARLFGQESRPVPNAESYPALGELQSALREAAQRLEERLMGLPPEEWAGPLPDIRFRDRFPSLGNAVVHILLAHTSFHAGQLSVWRQAVDAVA